MVTSVGTKTPSASREPRVVGHHVRDHDGVGNGHVLRFEGLDLGRQRADLCHHPLHVAHGHEVSDPQRPRVGEGEPAHHLVDDSARAQREHQPDEHAHPLEGVGAAAGQVRVGNRDAKQPQPHGQELAGGLRRLRVHPRQLEPALFDREEQHIDDADHEPREQEDEGDGEQSWKRFHNRHADTRQLAEEKGAQRLSPRARVGEASQAEGEPGIGKEQEQGYRQGADAPIDEFEHAGRTDQLRIADLGRL